MMIAERPVIAHPANIVGEEFRRVTRPEERRGILGQGSMLMQTSVADRTSPVQRGKWVMMVLLDWVSTDAPRIPFLRRLAAHQEGPGGPHQ